MTRTPPAKAATQFTASTNDAWLFDEPALDDEGLALLAAYRAASEASRESMMAQAAALPAEEPLEAEHRRKASQSPGVLRLHSIAGVRGERINGLHGQLLAAGYLTAEIVGRSDGLSYHVTREGLQRLSGESHAEAA